MITQYPHTLTYKTVTGSTGPDNDGNYTPGTEQTIVTPCRAEVNNSGQGFISAVDGSRINYDWIVYLPSSSVVYLEGSTIEIANGPDIVVKDTIKRFWPGQLNMRIWL
jgi:hypothetical protein